LKVGAGSVTNIIKEWRRKDCQFDLLRVLAKQLRDQNITVELFAPLIRFRELAKREFSDSTKSIEQIEKEVESLMEAVCVFCFNQELSVEEFGNMIYNIYLTAKKFGIALANLPDYVKELNIRAAMLRNEIGQLNWNKQRVLRDYDITMDTIEDILSNGPYMLGAYLKMKAQLREAKKELELCRIENFNLKVEIVGRQRHRE
jgi:hypothetical protein